MSVKLNGKKVDGVAGWFLGLFIVLLVGIMFSIVATLLLAPFWIPVIIAFLIGKSL